MRKTTLLLFAVLIALFVLPFTAHAATRISRTAYVGDSFKLKVTGTKKKPKWSSSNKKVATVNKKGIVRAKKAGKATITAKVGGRKLRCILTVLNRPTPAPSIAPAPIPAPTPAPVVDQWNGPEAISAIQVLEQHGLDGKVLVRVKNNYRFSSSLTATCYVYYQNEPVITRQDFLYMEPGWEGDLLFTFGGSGAYTYRYEFSVRDPYVIDCVGSWCRVISIIEDSNNTNKLLVLVKNFGPAAVTNCSVTLRYSDSSETLVDAQSKMTGQIASNGTYYLRIDKPSYPLQYVNARVSDAYRFR